MAITITLSEALSERLQAHAAETHLSPHILVEELLADALPPVKANGVTANGMHVAQDPDDESHPTLEEVVALIKATPPNPDAIEYGNKVGDKAYLQYLLESPPTDTLTFTEWEEQWAVFERELKELDQARAIKRELL